MNVQVRCGAHHWAEWEVTRLPWFHLPERCDLFLATDQHRDVGKVCRSEPLKKPQAPPSQLQNGEC